MRASRQLQSKPNVHLHLGTFFFVPLCVCSAPTNLIYSLTHFFLFIFMTVDKSPKNTPHWCERGVDQDSHVTWKTKHSLTLEAVVSPRWWSWCCGPRSTLCREVRPAAPSWRSKRQVCQETVPGTAAAGTGCLVGLLLETKK